MKIRVKLALLAVSLCALAIAACCTVLIISANGNSVNTAIDGALSEQHLLVQSFQSALRNTYEDGLSDTTQQSLGKYLFRQYSSGSLSRSQYAMRKDGEYLHNGSELDPADILTDAKTRSGNGTEVKYTIVMHDNARHIVVGSANSINGGVYDIYLVKNIEQVYSSNASLTAKLAAVSLGLVLLTAAVLAYSVFRVQDVNGDGNPDNCAFLECKKMFKWAFDNLKLTKIADPSQIATVIDVKLSWSVDHVRLIPEKEVTALVPTGTDSTSVMLEVIPEETPTAVNAPVKKGEVIGKARIMYAEQEIATVNLVAAEDIKVNPFKWILHGIKVVFTSVVFRVIFILAVIVLGIYIFSVIRRNQNKKRRRKTKVIKNFRNIK